RPVTGWEVTSSTDESRTGFVSIVSGPQAKSQAAPSAPTTGSIGPAEGRTSPASSTTDLVQEREAPGAPRAGLLQAEHHVPPPVESLDCGDQHATIHERTSSAAPLFDNHLAAVPRDRVGPGYEEATGGGQGSQEQEWSDPRSLDSLGEIESFDPALL